MIVVDTIFVQQGCYGSCLSRTIHSSRSNWRSAHFIGNIGIAPPPRDPGFHPEPTSCPPLCRVTFHGSLCGATQSLAFPQSALTACHPFPQQLPRCCAVATAPASDVFLVAAVPYRLSAECSKTDNALPGTLPRIIHRFWYILRSAHVHHHLVPHDSDALVWFASELPDLRELDGQS